MISGERSDSSEKLAYQQMEIRYGRFRTQVYLPWAVDSARVEATYDLGLLRVFLPKTHALRIPVEAAEDSAADS